MHFVLFSATATESVLRTIGAGMWSSHFFQELTLTDSNSGIKKFSTPKSRLSDVHREIIKNFNFSL